MMEQDNDDTFLTLIQVLSGGITLEERGEMHEKIVKEISRATAIDSQVVYSYWEILLPRDIGPLRGLGTFLSIIVYMYW